MSVCTKLAGSMNENQLYFFHQHPPVNFVCSCEQTRNCATQFQADSRALMVNYSSAHMYVKSLKACAKLKDLQGGLKLHSQTVELGFLETNPFVGSTLVDMYAKCGSLTKAEQVFQKLAVHDVVSWTALIAGYVDQGQCREALKCFERMQVEGVFPNVVTFSCTLRACSSLEKGQEIHAEIERQGLLGKDLIIGNSLLDMYTRRGLLVAAQDVFNKLPTHNVISWTSLISGYVEHGYYDEAVECYENMQFEGVFPNAVTYVCCLKAFSCTGAIGKGQNMHAEIERQGLIRNDPFIGSTLVDMYAKCGLLSIAQQVFEKLQPQTIVSWNALIAGYTEHGDSANALKCFEQIQVEGISLDAVTFVCCLKACGNLGTTYKGKELHAKLEKLGLLESDSVIGNAILNMYGKCGSLAMAQQVFDKLLVRDTVSWTALMAGYAEHGFSREALDCFEQMRLEGIFPDAFTLACTLKACSNIGAADKGKEIYIKFDQQARLRGDLFVSNSLVEMYVKCGLLNLGQHAFDKLPVQDDVSWNTMIAGYAKHGHGKEALKWFERVRAAGISPNAAMLVWSMKACGSMGAIDKAEEFHSEIESLGLMKRDMVVSNALLSMYVESGCLTRAEQVFSKLLVRDVVSWTTLLAGYSQLGESESVFLLFEGMVNEGIKPDSVAFVVLLSACARTGMCDKSQTFFSTMTRKYGIAPNLKHHGCIANLFGRAGQVDKALAITKKTPHHLNMVLWNTVLGACKNWGCVDLGKHAFESSIKRYS